MRILLDRHFEDFDELVEAARAWDLEMCQLESGLFENYALQLAFDHSLLSHAVFNGKNLQKGEPPNGLRTFVLLAGAENLIWRDTKVNKNHVMVYPAGGEHEAVTWNRCGVYTLSFTEEYLQNVCQLLNLNGFESLFDGMDVKRADPFTVQKLRRLLHKICYCQDQNTADGSASDPDIELEIARRLLSALWSSRPREKKLTPRKRDQAVKRVVDYLAQIPDEPHTVRDLCRLAQVSERTLQYGFLEKYGVTPKRYLLAHRLKGAHKELRRNSPSTVKVSDIANRWGFWHLGQFAADYRRYFGQLPSETLAVRPAPHSIC